jgi:hypothetical protein
VNEAMNFISRELDRQERLMNRPEFDVSIGGWHIRGRLNKRLTPQEVKMIEASQTLTDYLLEVSNPFGEFTENDGDSEPSDDLCDCSDRHRVNLPDFTPKVPCGGR